MENYKRFNDARTTISFHWGTLQLLDELVRHHTEQNVKLFGHAHNMSRTQLITKWVADEYQRVYETKIEVSK